MTYIVDFEASNDRLNVYCSKVYLQKYTFKGDFQPSNSKLTRAYASEVIYFFGGYKPGTGFRIRSNSSEVFLKENAQLVWKSNAAPKIKLLKQNVK